MRKVKLIATIMSLTMALGLMGFATYAAVSVTSGDITGTINIDAPPSITVSHALFTDSSGITGITEDFSGVDLKAGDTYVFWITFTNPSSTALTLTGMDGAFDDNLAGFATFTFANTSGTSISASGSTEAIAASSTLNVKVTITVKSTFTADQTILFNGATSADFTINATFADLT